VASRIDSGSYYDVNHGGFSPLISAKRVSWSEVCDELRQTFGDDEEEIKHDVHIGVAACWRVGGLALIARKEQTELVIMCLAGEGLKDAMPALMKAARQGGCKTARFHAERMALGRQLKPFGFVAKETIFRAPLWDQKVEVEHSVRS